MNRTILLAATVCIILALTSVSAIPVRMMRERIASSAVQRSHLQVANEASVSGFVDPAHGSTFTHTAGPGATITFLAPPATAASSAAPPPPPGPKGPAQAPAHPIIVMYHPNAASPTNTKQEIKTSFKDGHAILSFSPTCELTIQQDAANPKQFTIINAKKLPLDLKTCPHGVEAHAWEGVWKHV